MKTQDCARCGREAYTGLPFCCDCLAELATPPPGEPVAVYTTPNCHVALYAGGDTRHFDGRGWTEPHATWPQERHWRGMLEQHVRSPHTITAAGWRVLGRRPPVDQPALFEVSP